jgi:DNA-binding GntR family transcriptional regulator
MSDLTTNPTRAELLADRIADDIVSGRLRPGTALEETGLAEAHGVSRTPVREALRLLAATGLVQMRPRRGAVVAAPAPALLADMFFVMAELEATCASLAASGMRPAARLALQGLHAEMGRMVHEGRVGDYRAANIAFHQALYDGAANAYLAELAAATRRRLAPFRGAQLEAPDRLRISHAEHGEILQAVLRGDREGAARAVRSHLAATAAAWTLLGQNRAA